MPSFTIGFEEPFIVRTSKTSPLKSSLPTYDFVTLKLHWTE